jgi:hypothetical protein
MEGLKMPNLDVIVKHMHDNVHYSIIAGFTVGSKGKQRLCRPTLRTENREDLASKGDMMTGIEQAVKVALCRHADLADSVANSKRKLEKAVIAELAATDPQMKSLQESIRKTRKMLHRKRLHRSRRMFCIKTIEKKLAKAREGLNEIEMGISVLEKELAECSILEHAAIKQTRALLDQNLLISQDSRNGSTN